MVPLRIERRFQESESCVLTSYTMRPQRLMFQPISRRCVLCFSAHKTQQRKHPPSARMNPWLLSGLILFALTAVLTVVFMFQAAPPIPVNPVVFLMIQNLAPYNHVINICTEFDDLYAMLPKRVPKLTDSVVFYCDDNKRSSVAATIARHMGYTNVSYITGKLPSSCDCTK